MHSFSFLAILFSIPILWHRLGCLLEIHAIQISTWRLLKPSLSTPVTSLFHTQRTLFYSILFSRCGKTVNVYATSPMPFDVSLFLFLFFFLPFFSFLFLVIGIPFIFVFSFFFVLWQQHFPARYVSDSAVSVCQTRQLKKTDKTTGLYVKWIRDSVTRHTDPFLFLSNDTQDRSTGSKQQQDCVQTKEKHKPRSNEWLKTIEYITKLELENKFQLANAYNNAFTYTVVR